MESVKSVVARKLKELYEQSEARKQKNRLAFGETGEAEIIVGDRIEGLGMLGTGNLRSLTSGSATDLRLREHLKKQAQGKLSTTGSSGMKSSALNPTPEAITLLNITETRTGNDKNNNNNSRYFNLSSGFKRNKD